MGFYRPLPFPRKVAADLLSNPNTLATPLLAIVLAAYGDDIFGDEEKNIDPIDPIELWARLEEDFRTTIPDAVENRLNAINLAVSTDLFYEDPLVFTSVSLALSNGYLGTLPDGILESITLPEAAWSAYEVALNRDDDILFSPSIMRLIDDLVKEEAQDIQEGNQEPSNESYVREMKKKLAEQLSAIGIELPIKDLTAAG